MSSMRRGRVSLVDHSYFVTKRVLHPERGSLTKPEHAEIIISTLRWIRDEQYARICGFVIMPDHYHALIAPRDRSLDKVMASINRFTARHINAKLGRRGAFWQQGFYERAIRDRRDFRESLEYVYMNPVKEGFVSSPEQWVFSSANEKYGDLVDWEWVGIL
jgi:REP element-mobilizing transposase RayT